MKPMRWIGLLVAATMCIPAAWAAQKARDFREWINSPEAYYATAEEREAWKKVVTKEQADAFVAEYWHKRGPQFKKDVETRIEFADQHFSLPNKPGSETKQGQVWMILGSPSRTTMTRGGANENVSTAPSVGASPGPFGGMGTSIEQNAFQTATWVYDGGRLPKELGVPELKVIFQTEVQRGRQSIENPGLVEPLLKKMAEITSGKAIAAVAAGSQVIPSVPAAASAPAPAAEDPLWKAEEKVGGVFLTGEPFISPSESQDPFYAVSFYVPRDAEGFRDLQNVLLVGLVRNSEGQQVTGLREQMPLSAYSGAGDRFVEKSLPLPPGKYTGDFALYTPEGSTMLVNRRMEFEVPPSTATRVSTILLTSRIETLEKQAPLDPFTFVATRYTVKGDRKFTPGDKIAFVTLVSNPSGEPQPSMSMRMTITRDGKQVDRTPMQPVELIQAGPHTWLVGTQFEANTFKPGKYGLELQLRDTKAAPPKDAFLTKTEFEVVQ
jgi:GWxTD domain-containing protein